MGINLGVSANSLADGVSVIATNNNKLATSSSLNHGNFILEKSLEPSRFYSYEVAASSLGAVNAGIYSASNAIGSVYFTPKYSGNILFTVSITANSQTSSGVAQSQIELVYGSGTPPSQGSTAEYPPIISNISPVLQTLANGTSDWQVTVSASNLITGLTIGTQYWFDVIMGVFDSDFEYSSAITTYLYQVYVTWFEI
jgi:hypothetical protein